MTLARRPATEADLEFVRTASLQAYEEVARRRYGTWDESAQARAFDEKWRGASFEVIEFGGRPVGALWTSDEGTWLRLREIFLLPEYQGRGIGTTLLREELRTAREAGKPLRLRVLPENRAVALYERLGFRVIGEENGKLWMEALPEPPAATMENDA